MRAHTCKIVVWTDAFEDWLRAALNRLPDPSNVRIYHARTGKVTPTVVNATDLSSVHALQDDILGTFEMSFDDVDEEEDIEPRMQVLLPILRKEVWVLLCGLRGDDTEESSREELEQRARSVLHCTQNQAEDIVKHILIVRALSAGKVPFMADAYPMIPADECIYNEYSLFAEVDDITAEDAAKDLVKALLSMADVIYDDVDFRRGENTNIQADVESFEKEMADAGIHARRPEFLPQSHVDESAAKERVDSLIDDIRYFGSKEIPDWFLERESIIQPVRFAALVGEIAQDIMKSDTSGLDDRANGVLYDAAMHFLESLFDAAASRHHKRQQQRQQRPMSHHEDLPLESDKAMLMREMLREIDDSQPEPEPEDALMLEDLRAVIPEAIQKSMKRQKRENNPVRTQCPAKKNGSSPGS